jgi:hypothetical protein
MRPIGVTSLCPACGAVSGRIRSRYSRRLRICQLPAASFVSCFLRGVSPERSTLRSEAEAVDGEEDKAFDCDKKGDWIACQARDILASIASAIGVS